MCIFIFAAMWMPTNLRIYEFAIAVSLILTAIHVGVNVLFNSLKIKFTRTYESHLDVFFLLYLACQSLAMIIFTYFEFAPEGIESTSHQTIVLVNAALLMVFLGYQLDKVIVNIKQNGHVFMPIIKGVERIIMLLGIIFLVYTLIYVPMMIRISFVFIPKYKQNKIDILLDMLLNISMVMVGFMFILVLFYGGNLKEMFDLV